MRSYLIPNSIKNKRFVPKSNEFPYASFSSDPRDLRMTYTIDPDTGRYVPINGSYTVNGVDVPMLNINFGKSENAQIYDDGGDDDMYAFLNNVDQRDKEYLKKAKEYLDTTMISNAVATAIPSIMNISAGLPDKIQQRVLNSPEFEFDRSIYEQTLKNMLGGTVSSQQFAKQMGRPELVIPMQNQMNEGVEKLISDMYAREAEARGQYLNSYVSNENNEAQINANIDQINAQAQLQDNMMRSQIVGDMASGLGQLISDYGAQKLNLMNMGNNQHVYYKLLKDAIDSDDQAMFNAILSQMAGGNSYYGASIANKNATDYQPK